jgi:hypothetical protein
MMGFVSTKSHSLQEEEISLLHRLRLERRKRRLAKAEALPLGARVADGVAAMMGAGLLSSFNP